ncbi:hypothetical protein M9M90_16680 [Phenylobacterium sp. LH3H17]|uniref:helix-turn-helix transcriptional regulator n=1 Tax=Phenylobacterium sp. LH3H17 TaxID=2903901 RepID=UPI0020C983AC|nr:hypothetical protein [Phenylobacterium sp. LH3H17]UTP38843.1 hypothetical protein M9M90_16680 [Phenylobacterium sp. LH3H17]
MKSLRWLVAVDGRTVANLSPDPARRDIAGAPIGRVLHLTCRDTATHLDLAIARAARDGVGGLVMAREANHQIGLLLSVRPARERGYAVVEATDLDAPPEMLDWAELAELFGISRAEAEIAIGLHEGADLALIAEQRGVQLDTVRNQVKSLLRKLGLASQKHLTATLVRVALAGPPRTPRTPGGELRIAS